jgi:hypothetical protein
MRGARIALGVVAMIAWIAIKASRPSRSYYTPPSIPSFPTMPTLPASLPNFDSTTDDDGKKTVPALNAGAEEGLTCDAVIERVDSGKKITLTLPNGGAATLTMSEPAGKSFAFGRGEILPGPREQGAKFVAAFAKWLHKGVPPEHKGQLEPFSFTFVRLGSDSGWDSNKLFFERDHKYAEVFFNVAKLVPEARFLEKDEDYRGDLVSLLAVALRDGVSPRHTPADDSDFASADPLAGKLEPLAESKGAKRPVFAGDGSFLAQRGPVLVVWKDPAQPPRVLARFDGSSIGTVRPSPKGGLVAITVVHPRSEEFISSDDPAELQIRALADGSIKGRVTEDVTQGSYAVWSPDGSEFALSLKGPKPLTRVYAADGTTRADCPIVASPIEWRADGLWLSHWDFSKKKSVQENWRWQPGAGAPQAAKKLDAGVPKLPLHDTELRKTLASIDEPQKIGPSRLVIPGSEPVVLDLATHKLRYLLPRGASRFEAASDDGAILLVSGADEQLKFARLQ